MSKGVSYHNPKAIRSGGAFSHVAIAESGRLAFIAGQTATDKDGNVVGPHDMGKQTHAVFELIGVILADIGADWSSVAQFTTYMVGAANRDAFAKARTEIFAKIYPDKSYPPNTAIIISGLAKPELLLEISVIARLP